LERGPRIVAELPVKRTNGVPTFEFTGAEWDAFLARACKPAVR
jgi:hypothetical protein